MPESIRRSIVAWKESLLNPHEHKDHRGVIPPDTTVINPENSTRQGIQESVRNVSLRWENAAYNSTKAALRPRNNKDYFNRKATLQHKLKASGNSMLDHIREKDNTAKAHSYDCFSDTVRSKHLTPTDIDYQSMKTHLFRASVYGKYSDLDRLYLPRDSKLPDEYYRHSSTCEFAALILVIKLNYE
jgi:hypothetical protein